MSPRYAQNQVNSETKEQYAEFLQSFEWDYFATITFKHERHDTLKAISDVWEFLNAKPVQPVSRAFLAAEPHQTGALHLHGLLLANFNTTWRPLPEARHLQYILDKRFGRSRIEAAREDGAVTNYCSKYVVKNNNLYDYAFLGSQEFWH